MDERKVILVVGASSGMGELAAQRLLAAGHKVWVAARRMERMQVLVTAGARALAVDVTDRPSVEAGIRQILSRDGAIDVVVVNAGMGTYGPIETVSEDEARRQFEVNVFGAMTVVRTVLPALRSQRRGRIVLTTSLMSHVTALATGWYSASKHALRALGTSLRQEVRSFGIEVVMVEPGLVRTEFAGSALPTLDRQAVSADYSPMVEGFRRAVAEGYRKAPDAQATARALVQASLARRPRPVYRPSVESHLYPLVRFLVGERWFDRILLATYGPSKTQTFRG